MDKILEEVLREREAQRSRGMDDFDKGNSENDWVAYIAAYNGRAAEKVFRNEREGLVFREMMVKVAALALAAIEAKDQGKC